MSQNGPFGIDPEEFDRLAREAGEGLRDALDRFGKRAGWSTLIDQFTAQSRPAGPATTGETGEGFWAIYPFDEGGGAHIEEVSPSELEARRANKNNPDAARRVRFLPYGIAVSVLDAPDVQDSFVVSGKRQLVLAVPEDDARRFFGLLGAADSPTLTVVRRA